MRMVFMARFRCGYADCLAVFNSEDQVRDHQESEHNIKPRKGETYWEIQKREG